MEERKKDHIELALDSRTDPGTLDRRFNYEPLLAAHPSGEDEPFGFLGKTMRTPIWVSSMTGGTKLAATINRNLARACNEFGMGMGLGSCRIIMDDKTRFEDFNMRPLIGDDSPFYANLGIAQVEEILSGKQISRIGELLSDLSADGLVIHINPIQEWCQPEGDRITRPPADTLGEFLDLVDFPVIVKEVGQGFGPASLELLLKLPLEAIEFGAYGGTNFTLVELERGSRENFESYGILPYVGHTAEEMVRTVNALAGNSEPVCKQLIISGGVKNFLDGYYLTGISRIPAVYGQASAFLQHARGDYNELRQYINIQVEGLSLAKAFLKIKTE